AARAPRRRTPSVEAQLLERPAPELVELITHLMAADPKNRAAVEIWLRGGLAPKDIAAVRNTVCKQLKRLGGRIRVTIAQVVREIKPFLKQARELEAGNPRDAALVYAAILEGVVQAGEEPHSWD